MMKRHNPGLVILAIVLLSVLTFSKVTAQGRLAGKVFSRSSRKPLAAAVVTGAKGGTLTTADGLFTLWQWHPGDTLVVSCIGYQTVKQVLTRQSGADTLRFYLQPASMLLNPVTVQGRQLYLLDSVRTRREFADVFNYQGATVKDAMLRRADVSFKPYDNMTALNNTTQIAGINVLQALALLDGNKKSKTKLQKTLQRDEDDAYADRRFSVRRVAAITKLRGDSLQTFISTYRPDAGELKSQSDYEVLMYIKARYDTLKQGKVKVKAIKLDSMKGMD
ncbi:carboxypeptidase-like regulatory domain-containing protein [Mucilaginibacter sp. CSA2-8R]|uniref:carboxypeptidase-like regulatory domain-containing protein n=1 Tax=Mucilaginibacter sp. CSA2-8R TaxID=3141542 RepID=UPI00315D6C74